MGDVLDSLMAVDTHEDAIAFLERAQKEIPDAWRPNLRYAFDRYVPESMSVARAIRLQDLLIMAGWER